MKKRILEVIIVCLFCILEAGAACFYVQTQKSTKVYAELEARETAGSGAEGGAAAPAEEEKNTDGETDGAEAGSEELEEGFPVLVWSETVICGENSCQITFERIGPLYDTSPETADTPSYHADYRLSLSDANGALLSELVIDEFPVRLEEVYWIRDFSGDGFADVAFCTVYRNSHMMNVFYIWNAENSRYEAASLPLPDDAEMEMGPLWNEELSCVITFHGWDGDTAMPVLEMYSFLDGEWQRVRRLEAIASDERRNMDWLEYSGKRRELSYENGEVIGEKIVESNYDAGTIWYRPDSVWSCYYEGNVCLYPDKRYWEGIETSVDGFLVKKYVRMREDGEEYQREYDDWHDMLEDKRLPYANTETFEFLRDAYAEINFSGELESGDLDIYPLYLDAFYRLFQEDALLTDRETGGTMLLSEFPFFEDFFTAEEGEDESWSKKDRYSFGFFDMDGDGAPELTVYQFAVGYVVLDYNVKEDVYTIWYDAEACWYGLAGSGKMLWAWDGRYLAFYQLDESGAEACGTFCGSMYYNGEEAVCLVMLPTYTKEEERLFVPEEIQAQGSYSQLDGQWCFRVTGEQYAEITEAFWDAYDLVKEHKERGFDTYEELFGAPEAEDVRGAEAREQEDGGNA